MCEYCGVGCHDDRRDATQRDATHAQLRARRQRTARERAAGGRRRSLRAVAAVDVDAAQRDVTAIDARRAQTRSQRRAALEQALDRCRWHDDADKTDRQTHQSQVSKGEAFVLDGDGRQRGRQRRRNAIERRRRWDLEERLVGGERRTEVDRTSSACRSAIGRWPTEAIVLLRHCAVVTHASHQRDHTSATTSLSSTNDGRAHSKPSTQTRDSASLSYSSAMSVVASRARDHDRKTGQASNSEPATSNRSAHASTAL